MTRSSSSAIVAAAALFAASVPTLWSAPQDAPHLDGSWTLNRAFSQIPRDVGFNSMACLRRAAHGPPQEAAAGADVDRRVAV